MDIDAVRRFAELKRLLSDKEADVAAIKEQLKPLEQQVIEEYADNGLQSVKVDNGEAKVNVYIQRQLFARNLMGPDATVRALKQAGLGHMVKETANTQTLSAYFRDLENAGEEPPEAFRDVVDVFEKFSARVRAS